jgi:hypothetical protein
MNLQNLFDCFVLIHEAASKFIEAFVLDISPYEAVDESNFDINNYCEENRRGTYAQYRVHLD